MKDFIIGLYSNDNFPIYLGIIIFILVIAFLVVYYFGKKDKKKIEETAKLQKIKDDAFKEESKEEQIEIEKNADKEIKLPLTKEKEEKISIEKTDEEIDFLEDDFVDTLEIEMPKLVEDEMQRKPDFKKIAEDLENEIASLENIKKPAAQSKVFSSVYVPKKEIVIEESDEVIELPKLK